MTELLELVQSGKWEEAGILAEDLKKAGEASEEFMILYATICAEQGTVQDEYEAICRGVQNYPMSAELYYMLGNYYMGQQRSNLAYLCYEQAKNYSRESDDRQVFEESIRMAAASPDFEVNEVSVVIPAEEDADMLRDAVQSIVEQEAGIVSEIIVVDNECLGQPLEWLHEYEQVRIVTCSGRTRFAEGANIGIKVAQIYNDIYLMSSDAILLPNTLFWLRMGLYERETIGAAGGISNESWPQQKSELSCRTYQEYAAAAQRINVPDEHGCENRIWLDAFSLLLRRRAIDDTGLFEGKSAGRLFSVMDYGMKLIRADYEVVLCHNSFVYRRQDENHAEEGDLEKFEAKWRFPVLYYSNSRSDLIKVIKRPQWEEIGVLEVGCGCGSTLSAIRYEYPNAHVYGIELMPEVAVGGKYMADIIVGDIETMEMPYEEHMFDYIMFGDVLEHLRDPKRVVENMKRYLRPGGKILASIPNVMNIEVVVSLLKGDFTYRDHGLLDRTHIHLFTLREIGRMFQQAGYVIENIWTSNWREGILEKSEENERIIEAVYRIEGIADREEFEVYQYLVECAVCE